MSNKVQGLVWDIEFPNAMAKMIALKLADWANDDGGNIYPSTTGVARKTGCSRSVVCKWQYAMEHCGLLRVVERSQGGNKDDTTIRAFDMDLLRRLAWPDKDTPSELILIETTISRPVLDKKTGAPLQNPDGSPRLADVTVFEIRPRPDPEPVRQTDGSGDAPQAAPVRETDGSEGDPSATRTAPVRQTDGTRPPDGHEPFNTNPLNKPFDSPPTPPEGGGGGIFSVDWIEELRAEGCAPVVLDHFLLPLLAAGLKPWKDVPDPKLPARQLCEDFKRRSPEVLREAADRLLDTHRHRLPPVAAARAAVKAAGDRAALLALRERSTGPSEPEMRRFDRGTPEYERELARWRREDPAWAARIESQGFVRLRVREAAA